MELNLKQIRYADFLTSYGYDENIVTAATRMCCGGIDFDLWQLTIADFGDMMRGTLPHKILGYLDASRSTYEYLSAQTAVQEFVANFVELIKQYSHAETAEEKKASIGLPRFNENEGMLVFARAYFGLRSFSDAEQVTLADFLLAKKDAYIRAEFERNYQRLQTMKIRRNGLDR